MIGISFVVTDTSIISDDRLLPAPDVDPHSPVVQEEVHAELSETLVQAVGLLQQAEECRAQLQQAQESIALARAMIERANDITAQANKRMAQVFAEKDRAWASLSPEARELFADAGGVYVGDDLWVWVGSTSQGTPILRKIAPIVAD